MDKPWKVIFAFIAVFMAGAVFGGLFTLRASGRRFAELQAQKPAPAPVTVVTPPAAGTTAAAQPKAETKAPTNRGPITPALMRQFQQRLKLTPAQRERINPIVSRAAEDLQRLRQENERERQQNLADTVRVTDRMYSDVAALLSPDQREGLETMRAQSLERAEKERKHRAELQANIEAALKAERANADGHPVAVPPPSVPAAKTPEGK